MSFAFTDDELKSLLDLKNRCEHNQSLMLPSLWIVQRRQGFIGDDDILYLEKTLGISAISYLEVVSFFAMFNREKKAKHNIKLCKTLSCKLNGADNLMSFLEQTLKIKKGEITPDGLFSLGETECLGYCENAPAMLVDLKQFSNLDEQKLLEILEQLREENDS